MLVIVLKCHVHSVVNGTTLLFDLFTFHISGITILDKIPDLKLLHDQTYSILNKQHFKNVNKSWNNHINSKYLINFILKKLYCHNL